MTSSEQSETWLSLGLAFIGGYADAASYTLVGTFTGHITGNSILGAINLASGDWLLTLDKLLAVIAFLLGLPLCAVVDWLVKSKPSRSPFAVALFLEAVLFFMAAGLELDLHQALKQELFIICLCLALGIQNGTLRKANGVSVHTTYITGTVTSLIEHEFDRIKSNRGHRRIGLLQSLSSDPTFRLLSAVWFTFLVGAVVGGGMGLYFKGFAITGITFVLLLLAFFKLHISHRVSRH